MNFRGAAVQKAATAQSRIRMREIVSATRLGQKALARTQVLELLQDEPDNEQALLWAAALADSPEEANNYLERVLSVNPLNQQAANTLAVYRLNPTQSKPQAQQRPPDAAPNHVHESTTAPDLVFRAAPTPAGRVIEFREMLRRGWSCPLCGSEAPQPQKRCNHCGCLLGLDDLQAVAENRGVNEKVLLPIAEQLEKKAAAETGSESFLNLARVLLNLNRSAEALPWLRKAAGHNPTDTALRIAVKKLESRPLIMAVDDSTTLRRILTIMLERKGYRVLTASDGMQALARLHEQIPGLILLDITMPHMDGYQICKLIKQDGYTKHIPVVMLSGNDGFFDKVKGKLAGASDYVTKPFEDEQLSRTVQRYIKVEPVRN
ncbi:MAG: response regulator [Acidobacteriia bacterium]|nr:response regulator [Terriglobia bacterium]